MVDIVRTTKQSIDFEDEKLWNKMNRMVTWSLQQQANEKIIGRQIEDNLENGQEYVWGNFCPSTSGSTRWLCLKAQMLLVKDECECISRC
jgi:hypothetical protein